MEINKKIKQIFNELHEQFSDEYNDSQILIAAYAMYESLGEKYYRVDYSHRDYFFTGLPKAVDKAMEDPWKVLYEETENFPTFLCEEWSN